MPGSSSKALVALLLAGALCFGIAACGDDGGGSGTATGGKAAGSETPGEASGGGTSAGATRGIAGGVTSPIGSGELDVDTASGSLRHRGGLRLSVAGRDVEATDLVLEPGKGVLTAEVAGRRVPLLALDMGRPEAPGNEVVWPASAGLSDEAARTIDDRLGVGVFSSGLPAGQVTIDARRP